MYYIVQLATKFAKQWIIFVKTNISIQNDNIDTKTLQFTLCQNLIASQKVIKN